MFLIFLFMIIYDTSKKVVGIVTELGISFLPNIGNKRLIGDSMVAICSPEIAHGLTRVWLRRPMSMFGFRWGSYSINQFATI